MTLMELDGEQLDSRDEAVQLSALALFHGLPQLSLRTLEEKSITREYKAGHIVFKRGEAGQFLFVLEKGHVQTFRTVGLKKLVIADLKAPAVFGEVVCMGHPVYHCSAEAVEHSRVRLIPCGHIDRLIDQHVQIARRLLELVSDRLLRVLAELESTSFRNLVPRVANLLLEAAEGSLVRGMTHKEIAARLHVYRESATAALGELRKAGIIRINRKQVTIVDRGRLERAARE